MEGFVFYNDVSFCSVMNGSIWCGLITSSEALVIIQVSDDGGLK